MTKEEKELLLTVARLLRTHMSDHHNNNFEFLPDDLKALNEALKTFNSNTLSIRPDGEKKRNE